MGPTPNHFRLSPAREVPDVCCFFAFLINDKYIFLCLNFITMYVSIDAQKLIRAYVYCYVLSCRLKINFLILSQRSRAATFTRVNGTVLYFCNKRLQN